MIILFFLYFISFFLSLAAMEILSTALMLGTVIALIKNRKFIWPHKLVLIAFAGLLASAIISFWINIQKPGEFFDYVGDFRWMLLYIGWLQFFNFYFAKIDFKKLVLTGQITLILVGFYSFLQVFTAKDPFRPTVVFHKIFEDSPYVRPNAFFGLPTTYSYACAMFFAVSLAFLIYFPEVEKKWQLWLRRVYFVMAPLNIFIAFTRAAWIASISSTLMVLKKYNHRRFYQTVLLLVVFCGGSYASFPSFRNRINSIFDSQYVANENRIYLWKANFNIFKENPVFGLGFDENRKQIDRYLEPFNKPNVMRNHPHNTYVNFLAGLGITGLSFLLLFVGFGFVTTFKTLQASTDPLSKAILLGCLGLQLVIWIGAFAECNFEDNELCHQYILFAALAEFMRLKMLKPQRVVQ